MRFEEQEEEQQQQQEKKEQQPAATGLSIAWEPGRVVVVGRSQEAAGVGFGGGADRDIGRRLIGRARRWWCGSRLFRSECQAPFRDHSSHFARITFLELLDLSPQAHEWRRGGRIGRELPWMSEFLSRIKARLETGQHLNSATSEEPGWVRAALSVMDKEPIDFKEGPKDVVIPVELTDGWQTDLVERMKVVGFGSQDGQESPFNLTVSAGSPVSDDISPRCASQKLWETGSLESRIPDGFYSVIPTKILKAKFMTIPTFEELKKIGVESSSSDVLLVDSNEDKVLARLKELAISAVKTVGTNPALVIKKIAELVADFYGGPISEAGLTKVPVDGILNADSSPVQLLGKIEVGLCRPRAILFKFLGDAVGLHSRLLMGLQLEAVPGSSVICANPNKHLSNIVGLNGMELLVDVMRRPGNLRPFSKKALIMYHISGAGDSDSADYDSCDSPLEPNSPLCGYSEKLESESLDHEVDSPRILVQRRQTSPVGARPVHNMLLRLPMGLEGKLSPSRSEPDLANPYRRRNRRKAEESSAIFSPERAVSYQQLHWKVNAEGVRSFPSSPEHPQARIRSFRRVGSEEGSISSSPEHPTFRVRAPSMLGGGRRPGSEEVDPTSVSSPEQSPQYFSSTGTPSPIYRRRRERSLSIDIQRDGLNSDTFRIGPESEFPRTTPSPDVRRPRKRSVAPEISDDVVRAVREMNEKLKQERCRSRATEQQSKSSNADGPRAEDENEGEEGSTPAEKVHLRTASDPTSLQSTVGPFVVDDKHASTYEEKGHCVDKKKCSETRNSCSEKESTAESSNHTVDLKPPAWLNGPLMPFSEWHIDYKELRIGVRVGIGSFGEVFRGMWRGTEVAIKRLLEQDLTDENTADFCNEISLLSRLRHPNVILFMGACTTPPHLSMVTEYMHMGSLYSLVHLTGQGKKLSYRRRLKMLRDICRGMMSVQRMNIVHRDLKSANCLVDKHWTVKICDFGLSRLASGPVQDSTAAGTPEWMAPELLRNEPVTDKCDVFSLGVIMWELCTLKRPWKDVEPMQVVYKVAHAKARLEIPEGLLGKLIADCWAEVPSARPSYDEILTRLHECEFLQS
ncbi:protein MpMAPKKK26 [Marchantia polymorpha subsp. ruderalis]